MSDITWSNIRVKLGDLKPWGNNPRMSTKAQAKRLLKSFEEFGQVETIAVGPTLDVYNGHQRLSALLTIHGKGYEVDARQSDRVLTEDERKRLTVYLHAGAVGQWDWDALSGWDAPQLQEWGMNADTLKDWTRDVAALGEMLASDGDGTRPHVANNSGNNEWYTPAEYIEAARLTLGEIDLDPASSVVANSVVRANAFYTAADDGLSKPWAGRVWMNPPYADELIGRFVDRLVDFYEVGDVSAAVVLVNNATETAWFGRLVSTAKAVCFPQSRVKFWQPLGDTGAPLQGQAVVYLGDQVDLFLQSFDGFGWRAVVATGKTPVLMT